MPLTPAEFIEKYQITFTSKEVDWEEGQEPFSPEHIRCSIKIRSRFLFAKKMKFRYGYNPSYTELDLADVLHCLLSDSTCGETFEGWASNMGMDVDSISSLKMYHAIQEQEQKVNEFFGPVLEEMQEVFQDY